MTKKLERADIEHISNIVKIAVAKGTDEEPTVEGGIDAMINLGVAQIQSKILMFEAFKIESKGNSELIDRVTKTYNRMAEELGYLK